MLTYDFPSTGQLEVIRTINPKINLERIETMPIKAEQVDEPSADSDSQENDWLPDDNDFQSDSLSDNQDLDSPKEKTLQKAKPVLNSDLVQQLSKTANEYLQKHPTSANRYQCLLCDKLIIPTPSRASFHSVVVFHVAMDHVEEFFMNIKCKNLGDSQFAKICQFALRSEFHPARQFETGRKIVCTKCNFTCSSKTHRTFRMHLLKNHRNILEQKILGLQKELISKEPVEVEQHLNKRLPQHQLVPSKCKHWKQFNHTTKTFFKNHQCTLCGVSLSEKCFRLHLVRFHPETFFESSGTWDIVNKEQFHDLCDHVIESEANLAIRVELSGHHKKYGINGYECHLCGVGSYENLNKFIYHLASNHFRTLEEKLKQLVEDSNRDVSKLKAQNIGRIRGKSKFSTSYVVRFKNCDNFCEQLANGSKLKCIFCNDTFSAKSRRNHFIRHHLEKVFEEMKLNSVSESQFKMCCSEIIDREFATDRKTFMCRYCNKRVWQSTQAAVKYHLVRFHFEILEEHLVRLQTDRIWENTENLSEDSNHIEPKRKHADTEELDSIKRIKTEYCYTEDNDLTGANADADNMAAADELNISVNSLAEVDFKSEIEFGNI